MAQPNSKHSPDPSRSPSLYRRSLMVLVGSTSATVLSAWFVSMLIHAVLFFIMFVVVFPYTPKLDASLPVTRAELVGDPEALAFDLSPVSEWAAEAPMPATRELRFTPRKSDQLAGLATLKKPELPIIGIGAGSGDFSKYGLGVSDGTGPEFFGLGGTARGTGRIVYVVDRSGSMLDTFDVVRQELKRSVEALRRSQKFHVILFNSGAPLENPPKRLVSAIPARKQKLFKFLDSVMPDGGTDPGPAMRRAFSVEPELIYFLTDGQFDPVLLKQLDQWNKDRRVRIFTIAFFGAGGAELLERIAREHDGEFRFITEDDLP